jgi:hypothetical protein
MIDKLDLRIPSGSVFSPEVREYTRALPYETYTSRVRPAVHYTGKADLRGIGIDAMLHMQCKHGDHHHKLEIFDVGKKPYSEIAQLIQSITDAYLDILGVMRIDLAADVPDVTVPWFKDHVRFKFKRTDKEHGALKYGMIGHGETETLIAGTRPNVFRIYNKTAEWKVQFRRMVRRTSKDADPLDFEKEFGIRETDLLTRIERQCGGDRIPPELSTFGHLMRAREFNPFDRLEIISSGRKSLPTPDECDGLEYYTGFGMHAEAERVGMQEFRKRLNKQTRGNAARTLQRYSKFFPDGFHTPITVQQIYATYRASLLEQLAA